MVTLKKTSLLERSRPILLNTNPALIDTAKALSGCNITVHWLETKDTKHSVPWRTNIFLDGDLVKKKICKSLMVLWWKFYSSSKGYENLNPLETKSWGLLNNIFWPEKKKIDKNHSHRSWTVGNSTLCQTKKHFIVCSQHFSVFSNSHHQPYHGQACDVSQPIPP